MTSDANGKPYETGLLLIKDTQFEASGVVWEQYKIRSKFDKNSKSEWTSLGFKSYQTQSLLVKDIKNRALVAL